MARDKFIQNESVSVRELYTLIDSKIGQVNDSILRVDARLNNLESGLVSTLQKDVSTMKGQMMIVPILISIAMGVFSFIVQGVVFKR